MKIRCIENNIRLRLTKSDLIKLKREEKIFESVLFPALNKFSFGISISDKLDLLGAEFDAGLINILLPKLTFVNWHKSNQISIEQKIFFNKEDSLNILIEKDLPCNDRPEEDKSNTFEELVEKSINC